MATTTVLKQNNILNILNIFKRAEHAAKPEIVRLTGLTGPTVNNLINELLKTGVIIDKGYTASSGGRRPALYALNPEFGFILGISIRLQSITAAIFDMQMNIIAREEFQHDLPQQSVTRTLDIIFDQVEKLLGKTKKQDKIIGIGINVPGPVDPGNGMVSKLAGADKWVNVPLKNLFEERYGIHTIVDKDTCSCVLYVKNKSGYNSENIVFLSTRDGLGTSIMINGSVYRGSHFIAGEIGHNTVAISDEKCSCGNSGCLELYIADPGYTKKISNASTALQKAKVITDALTYMKDAVGSLIRTYDPDGIVIDSDWVKDHKQQFFELLETLYEEDRLIERNSVRISLNETDDLLIKSAAMLILDSEFTSVEKSHFLN